MQGVTVEEANRAITPCYWRQRHEKMVSRVRQHVLDGIRTGLGERMWRRGVGWKGMDDC
jgi:hypothetical protein